MNMNPVMLKTGILKTMLESMANGIREMQAALRGPIDDGTIESLARIAHKLKGEATVTGMNGLTRLITTMEVILERLHGCKNLDRNQLKPVVIYLKKIVNVCQQLEQQIPMPVGQGRFPPSDGGPATTRDGFAETLRILTQNVAKAHGKRVSLNLENFDFSNIPEYLRLKIRDMVIQLIRNAVVHGIETPEKRKRWGKGPEGTVKVSLEYSQSAALVAVEDDGQGIDLEEIRKRLVVKYNRGVLQVANLSKVALLRSLFLPGFSTLDKRMQHAGRGVGLDLVRYHVNSLGGRIDVRYKLNGYTRFSIKIPVAATANITRIPTVSTRAVPSINFPDDQNVPLLGDTVSSVR